MRGIDTRGTLGQWGGGGGGGYPTIPHVLIMCEDYLHTSLRPLSPILAEF